MGEPEVIEDSQPDVLSDSLISWDSVKHREDNSTRKARQLDKIQKDLTPLNNEYKNIPRSRTRHRSFESNNQFTVVAAEFLNLSSKKELNSLFDAGYTKDEIENMLEHKYQEKKQFFTELNVKHHKFKRKSFESWRTMSNSASTTNNTFAAEEEVLVQITKSQQLRLKRINNQPLEKFNKPVLKKTEEKVSVGPNLDKNEAIQGEHSLVRITSESDNNGSLLSSTEPGTLEENTGDNDVSVKPLWENLYSKEENNTVLREYTQSKINNQNMVSSPIITSNFENIDRGEEPKGKIDKEDQKIDDFYTVLELTSSPTATSHKSFENAISVESEQENENQRISEIPIQVADTVTITGRHLRHRTIINRNPYLVDRAEYLGLSTRYELITMEEEGKTDDAILQYLDTKYQSRRKERKEKDVGYGPFSKSSFYEIINDNNRDSTSNENIVDTQNAFEMAYSNDDDSEFSIEEDLIENDLFYEDERSDMHDDNKYSGRISSHDINKDIFDLSGGTILTNKSDKSSMKKNRKRAFEHIDLEKSDGKLTPRQTISKLSESNTTMLNLHRLPTKKKKISSPITKSNASHENKILSSTYSENSTTTKNPINPYSMEFLTLSDEESQTVQIENTIFCKPHSDKIQKPKNYSSQKSPKKRQHSILSSLNLKSRSQGKNLTETTPRELESLSSTKNDRTIKKKKVNNKNIIAESFAPVNDPNFVFNRTPNVGTLQAEGQQVQYLPSSTFNSAVDFNVDFAKHTDVFLKSIGNKKIDIENNECGRKDLSTVQALWNKYEAIKDVNERKYKYILNIKPAVYATLEIPQKFLSSALLQHVLKDEDHFYRNKNFRLKYLGTSIEFEVPLKSENTISKIQAFLNVLYGSLSSRALKYDEIKQLRKCLITIIMIISNMKIDCIDIIPKVGLEFNSFLNRFKKGYIDDKLFCVLAPYFLLYMKMLQKYLPTSSEYISSFQNSRSWLCKKIAFHVCNISFENIFINGKSVILESLYLFLKCTNNPWSYVELALHSKDIDVLNVTNFLYFCNSYKKVEMDWEYYTTILIKNCDHQLKQPRVLTLLRNTFASVLKIKRELGWDLEDQLLVKMFRILAEYKFDNIGCSLTPKASIYPNIPATNAITDDDGCLDIYFKVLDIFTKQYLSENTRELVERLIPVRSTFGYNPYQLHNRAKVLLMMVYMFDQDLMGGIYSVLNDMIRNASSYSLKSSLALIITVIKQTPRKPYNVVRKFLPVIIHQINKCQKEKEVLMLLKDAILGVNELLNGQDISYMKRMLEFFGIILKIKDVEVSSGIDIAINKSFAIIMQQFEFTNGIKITERDQQRLKKSLDDIIENSKRRILDDGDFPLENKKIYLKFWLYFSSKIGKPALQLLYTEWNYFGTVELRTKLELTFYQFLSKWFDLESVKLELLIVFFKNLVQPNIDLSTLFNQICSKEILRINDLTLKNVSKIYFEKEKLLITRKCLSALFQYQDKKMVDKIISHFVISLKAQLVDYSSKEYVQNVCFYLFNIADDKIDVPEWDYLVSELKLDTTTQSISKKLQFVESVDDIAIVLEKNYINSIATNSPEKFMDQFIIFLKNSLNYSDNIQALCLIVQFHINAVIKAESIHWLHLFNWVKTLYAYISEQSAKLDISPILKLLISISRLNALFNFNYDHRFYYNSILFSVYQILDWICTQFLGFKDNVFFLDNFWKFAAFDPIINNNNASFDMAYHNNISLEKKLGVLYKVSETLVEDKIKLLNSEKAIYDTEIKVKDLRHSIIKRWNIRKIRE